MTHKLTCGTCGDQITSWWRWLLRAKTEAHHGMHADGWL